MFLGSFEDLGFRVMKIVRCCSHGEVVEIDASELFFTLSFSKHSKLTVLASHELPSHR
jgi:hypothetical protein